LISSHCWAVSMPSPLTMMTLRAISVSTLVVDRPLTITVYVPVGTVV